MSRSRTAITAWSMACGGGKRLEEAFRGLVADDAQRGNLAALRIEEDDAGWTEEREALEKRPVGVVRRRYVRLQEKHAIELGAHTRVGECELLHLLARHAPVRIEVEHRRFPRPSEPLVELRHRRDSGESHTAPGFAHESGSANAYAGKHREHADGPPQYRGCAQHAERERQADDEGRPAETFDEHGQDGRDNPERHRE